MASSAIHEKHGETFKPLTTTFVALLSAAFTSAYVLPLYLFSDTRPLPNRTNRDSPALIQARIRVVTVSCFCCSLVTLYIISHDGTRSMLDGIRLMGWYPIYYQDIVKPLVLTMLLFLGPLFERIIVEGGLRRYLTGRPAAETLGSWVGWRNYVAGPVTEEIMFRSLLTSLSLLTTNTFNQTVFITPLYFGLAHVHHFYEFTLTHPRVPVIGALLSSVIQFAYTTLFGWYANFVFVRTGSLYSVILIHSFCNWMGLPRLWGKVEAEEPAVFNSPVDHSKGPAYRAPYQQKTLSNGWTIAYYVLLVSGAVLFKLCFWNLTSSPNALAIR